MEEQPKPEQKKTKEYNSLPPYPEGVMDIIKTFQEKGGDITLYTGKPSPELFLQVINDLGVKESVKIRETKLVQQVVVVAEHNGKVLIMSTFQDVVCLNAVSREEWEDTRRAIAEEQSR